MAKWSYLEYPEYPPPSCVNCGFLGSELVWAPYDPIANPQGAGGPRWQVATANQRTTGGHDWFPECWRRKADLRTETSDQAVDADPESPPAALAIIRKQRPDCESWFHPWTPRWSPDQHLEEHKLYLLERDRGERDRDLRRSDRRVQIFIAVAAFITILVNIALNRFAPPARIDISSAIPVIVVTPVTPAAQSIPSTPAASPRLGP